MRSEELRWTEPGDEARAQGTLVGGQLDAEPGEFPTGARLGRYVVLSRTGSGAMGVVYAAYDPQLDRRIALKLMHPAREGEREQAERASKRLLAEAKALAQLRHPNVIAVHDVGTLDGRVFIAMEFFEGTPLSAWLGAGKREWREVLAVFLEAGRGLEAAHRAGLVHRDFKPDNVLVAADGQVRVLDFGLARRVEASETTDKRRDREAGTPAYMSPEQHLGRALDHRSDQFSFCVALYEALYGAPPFAARTRLELALAVTDGRIGPAPKRSAVPGFIRWALMRGLDPDPNGRWPDMATLLAALARDPYRQLRTAALWSLAIALVLGFLLAIISVGERDQLTAEVCMNGDAQLAEVWNHQRATTVAMTFRARAGAAAQSEQVIADLDGWAREWAATHREACEATAVHKTQSPIMLDRRMLCLDRRLVEVAALVDVFADAEVGTLARAREGTDALPELSSCSAAALEREAGPRRGSGVERWRVEQIEAELYRARNLELTGSFAAAVEGIERASTQARELGDPELLARALVIHAQIRIVGEQLVPAEALLGEAILAADRAGADRLRARALVALARVQARSGRAHEGEQRLAQAGAVLDRLGASPRDYAGLAAARAVVEREAGELDSAAARLEAAIDKLVAALAVEPVAEAGPGRSLLTGPPPELADLHYNLGVVRLALGQREAAGRALADAREQWVAHYGPLHPKVAAVDIELARIELGEGRAERVLAIGEPTLEVFEQAFGPSCLDIAYMAAVLAAAEAELGRHERALAYYARAREVFADHGALARRELAGLLEAEARLWRELGQLDRSLELVAHATALRQDLALARPVELAAALHTLGSLYLELARPVPAREPLAQALELLADDPRPPARSLVAEIGFSLARAWSEGEGAELERARELAQQSHDGFRTLGDHHSRRAVEQWLAQR